MNIETRISPSTYGQTLASHLQSNGFWKADGAETFANWEFYNLADWGDFARHWDDLLLDEYMRGGGTYRFRRYSQLELSTATGELKLLPHEPYQQSAMINTLNGGFERHFDPVEDSFLANPFFTGLMRWMGQSYTAACGHDTWNIKLHPYRIIATEGAGEPSPEGLHRDGVDYICSFMVRKCNVSGGKTVITDADRNEQCRFTLEQPGDIMIGDDHETMHGVSPIEIITPNKPVAYRDVLVVAFTKA